MSSISGAGAPPPPIYTQMTDPSSKVGTPSEINQLASIQLQQLLSSMGSQMTTNTGDLATMLASLQGVKTASASLEDQKATLEQLKAKLADVEGKLAAQSAPPPDPRLKGLQQTADALRKMLATLPPFFPRAVIQAQLAGIEKQIAALTPKAPDPGIAKLDPKVLDMMKAVDSLKATLPIVPSFVRPIVQAQIAALEAQIAKAKASSAPPPNVNDSKAELEAMAAKLKAQMETLTSTLNGQVAKINSLLDSQQQVMAQLLQKQGV